MTLITILGPTAVGKTKLAVKLAAELRGEIISADSRQVYKGMDIGTGKDLKDFEIDSKKIQHHLIDIRQAGEEYDVFQFQQDFYSSYKDIVAKKKQPILCGGTGLYLQAALSKNQILEVPINEELRNSFADLSLDDLIKELQSINSKLHNETDIKDRKRTIRAIEIELFKKDKQAKPSPIKNHLIFGIKINREVLREEIDIRLKNRLESGMIEEVQKLLKRGVTHEQLYYYGLEYRFISLYLRKHLTYNQMYADLLQAIRRFAKKQMTWFRRMERNGTEIVWLDWEWDMEKKLTEINKKLS